MRPAPGAVGIGCVEVFQRDAEHGRLAADLIAGDPPIVDPAPFRYSRMIDGTDLGGPGMM